MGRNSCAYMNRQDENSVRVSSAVQHGWVTPNITDRYLFFFAIVSSGMNCELLELFVPSILKIQTTGVVDP